MIAQAETKGRKEETDFTKNMVEFIETYTNKMDERWKTMEDQLTHQRQEAARKIDEVRSQFQSAWTPSKEATQDRHPKLVESLGFHPGHRPWQR